MSANSIFREKGDNKMNFADWKWLNESQVITVNGETAITAPAKTDWFNNPVPENGLLSDPVANAPFYYTEVEGDFVFRAQVCIRRLCIDGDQG